MIKTKICELLNIKYPILQGAMGWIADGTLAGHVSKAGGHIGQITTISLVPQVKEAVDIPVIAAGGIANGKQFAAALVLGADGVQVGTRFIVAHECNVHENYKESIIKAKDRSTVSTGNHTGHPVRVINNKLAKDMIKMEKEGTSNEILEDMGKGKLRLAVKDGDIVNGSVMAGQVASMVTKRESSQEIILNLMEDVIKEIESLKNRF